MVSNADHHLNEECLSSFEKQVVKNEKHAKCLKWEKNNSDCGNKKAQACANVLAKANTYGREHSLDPLSQFGMANCSSSRIKMSFLLDSKWHKKSFAIWDALTEHNDYSQERKVTQSLSDSWAIIGLKL